MPTSSVTNRTQPQVKTRSTPVEDRKPSTEPKKESSGAAARQPKPKDHFERESAGASTQSESPKTPSKKPTRSSSTQQTTSLASKQTPSTSKSTEPPASKPAKAPSTRSSDKPKKSSERAVSQELVKAAYTDNSAKAAEAKVDPRYASELQSIAKISPEKRKLIDDIARKADLPPALVAGIWYREGSLRKDVYMHNGDPLGKPTTSAPKGKSFGKNQFFEAALDAFNDQRATKETLNLHYDSKDLGAMATYAEAFNGFGYRTKGHTNPYAFSGTDQYTSGLYKKDHGGYDADARDERLGVLAFAQEYMKQ